MPACSLSKSARGPLFAALLASVGWLGPARAQTTPAKLIVRNATVVTLEDQQPDPFLGYMVVGLDGRIAAVGAGEPPAQYESRTTVDAAGKVVMPGFLSGHSHLWQSAYRGIAANQWVREWVQKLHLVYGPFFVKGDPYAFTLHGALDYLRHGITTTYNYSQNMGFSPELYEEQYEAEVDAGGRFIFGYALKNTPPLTKVRADLDRFLTRVKQSASPLLLKVSLASDGARHGPEYTRFEFDTMRELGLDLQMHYLEPPNHQKADQANFAWIESAHGLSPKLVFAHFIHTTDYILSQAGSAHAGMIWNPLSNGRLASGLADIPRYLKAGINVGMGIDGQASADVSDPFENMRLGLYAQRMKYQDPLILQPIDLLRLHTIGTARTLGVGDQVGSLKAGKFADFLVVDPANFDTGPINDLYATLVFACKISNLERVYVGGEWVVERGRPLRHDAQAVAAEVKRRVDAVRARVAAGPQPKA